MSVTKFYKIVSPRSKDTNVVDSQYSVGGMGKYGESTWYNKMVQGSASRRNRYREYDIMDNDPDIALALDLIAEEMTGNNPKGETPLVLELDPHPTQDVHSTTVLTLKAALKTFTSIQRLNTPRLFNLCRGLLKYGDAFYIKPEEKNGRWTYLHPKNVDSAIVAEKDVTDVKGWNVAQDTHNASTGHTSGLYTNVVGSFSDAKTEPYLAEDIVHFSLWDEVSEEAPFGNSILRAIYKPFKQKELLEDAIVIYRIQRAPERRVFYIDVGRIHPNQVAGILEKFKNDFRQKRIPSQIGDKSQVDAVYNPQSMQEDFFMAVNQGSQARIETLPGGQNLGNLDDLHIFFRKIWRGLKIPESYINTLVGDGGSGLFNDGRVGVAMMQEVKFTLMVERLQTYVEEILDNEFKTFLYDNGISVDPTLFRVRLPAPSNFKKSRQHELDASLLNAYGTVSNDNNISKRFALKKYLQLTEDEIIENERMLREEKGLDVDGGKEDLPKIYNPEEAEAGGFEGGLGGRILGGGGMTPRPRPDSGGPDKPESSATGAGSGDSSPTPPDDTTPTPPTDTPPTGDTGGGGETPSLPI